MILTPKNWNEFQHYKDREPSWIKLHKSLLTNYEYICLPIASKALAPMLWLLASEYKDGIIDASLDKIAFRLTMTRGDLAEAQALLMDAGVCDASEPLADCKQRACLEEEREKEDIEKRKSENRAREASGFGAFWDEWPNKVGKPAAVRAYDAAVRSGVSPEEILDGARNYIRDKPPDRQWLNPATFLNQKRWEDRPAKIIAPVVLTEHQTRRRQTESILNDLESFATGGRSGGQENSRLLPGNPGERPGAIRGRPGGELVDVSPGSRRESG